MILKANDIEKEFTGGGLSGVSFELNPGTFTLLTGESGIGKTTLLNIITGMLRPDKGSVFIDDKSGVDKEIFTQLKKSERIALLSHRIAYMMQGVSLIPSVSVYDNLVLPLELNGVKYTKDEVEETLNRLGIYKIKDEHPGHISGGEYRRVLLAGALLQKPELIVADEPTSNLDAKAAGIVRDVLYEYKTDKTSVLVATHDAGFEKADYRIEL